MNRMAAFLGFIFAATTAAQTRQDFAGQWVWKLGERNFFVLTLAPAEGAAGPLTGFLMRPQHFTSSDDRSFSQVSASIVRHPIVHSAIKDGRLSFATENAADKNDRDNYQFAIAGSDRALLNLNGVPFEPWPMNRVAGNAVVAADWDAKRTYSPDDSDVSSIPMRRIFDDDQKARQQGFANIDWSTVGKADADRRRAARALLDAGQLHTGEDFERAAFIFQHGDTPNDYLLAHTLAMVAVAKGQSQAIWIASAALDRYLNSIHQPQIYGTQFVTNPNQPASQEPYDRKLIPDALRRYLGVPSLGAQEEQRKKYDAEAH